MADTTEEWQAPRSYGGRHLPCIDMASNGSRSSSEAVCFIGKSVGTCWKHLLHVVGNHNPCDTCSLPLDETNFTLTSQMLTHVKSHRSVTWQRRWGGARQVGPGGRHLDLAPATLSGPNGPTGAGLPLGDQILVHFQHFLCIQIKLIYKWNSISLNQIPYHLCLFYP